MIMHRSFAKSFLKIDWPKEIIYKYKNGQFGEWLNYTIAHKLSEKLKKQNNCLLKKRIQDKIRAAYICVQELNRNSYNDYYIWLVTIDNCYYLEKEIKGALPDIFPLGVLPFHIEDWAKEFIKRFPKDGKVSKYIENYEYNRKAVGKCWVRISPSGRILGVFKV